MSNTVYITQDGRTGWYTDAVSLNISDLSLLEAFTFYPYDRGEKFEARMTVHPWALVSSVDGRHIVIERNEAYECRNEDCHYPAVVQGECGGCILLRALA